MKELIRVSLCLALILTLVTPASAVLRPRFPEKPSPPFSGNRIIISGGGFPPHSVPWKHPAPNDAKA